MYSLNLNTTGQEELYERACGRMAQLLPGWSDAIPSDPAVALLELASYLSHVQDREINTLRARHYLAYLKLLGQMPEKLAPARMLAVPGGCVSPWPGMRFEMDGVPFEAASVPYTGPCRVKDVSLAQGGCRRVLRADAPLIFTHETPAALDITFSVPFPPGVPVQLWLELQPEPGRMEPEEWTAPPVQLLAQIETGGPQGGIPCRDGTCGLLRSGYVMFTPPVPFDTLCLEVEGEIEGEPRISAVALYPVVLEQRRTRSQCLDLKAPFRLPPGWGKNWILRFFSPQNGGWREEKHLFVREGLVKGLSGQTPEVVRVAAWEPDFPALYPLRELPMETVRLEECGILPASLRLMVEEDGLWYDCPVCQPEKGLTLLRGCRWDETRQALRFGDGRDFCVPREGRLLVAGCACTLGTGGNGAGGLLVRDGVILRPLAPASGGQDSEDGKTAFFRAAKELERPARAVSLADYEALALRTPGLALARVRAAPAVRLGGAGPGVVVLAKPRSADPLPPLTRWQSEQLSAWLDRFRMIGVPVEVRGPRYCPVEVKLRIQSAGPVSEPALRAAAFRHTDGVTGPLDFGAELPYTTLFSALSAVSGVGTVRALELRALSGCGHRTQEGGIRLEADALPYLARFQVTEDWEVYENGRDDPPVSV